MLASFLESDLAPTLSLNGNWGFRLARDSEQIIPVPSAWEAHRPDKISDGPAFYRRAFSLPNDWHSAHIVLEARAISFDATLRVNGQLAGHHRGMWSPFQIEITPLVHPGENEIEIEAWKPGARFPVREALAGFLPDVCTTFGGIWQTIGVRAFAGAAFADVRVRAMAYGRVEVWGNVSLPIREFSDGEGRGGVRVELLDDQQQVLAAQYVSFPESAFSLSLVAPDVQPWPSALYSLRLSLMNGETVVAQLTRRIGFRDVAARARVTLLNDRPIHFRGVLDWGWNPERIAPTFTRAELLENFANARALGFNLFKLCLFVPDETFFDVADEAGMMLWLELPLWLPRLTPQARQLVAAEYTRLFQRLHHHPSIVLLSLGCEMNSEADAKFLSDLAESARAYFPNALHCDNSGSAEAYGGALTDLSDFYDYHFYTDPHFFASLVEHFQRDYRPIKPWIYGEFCDADTLRDFSQFEPLPGWLTEPVALEHDDYLYTRDYKARLCAANIADEGAALTGLARRQATALRKFIIEQVRSRHATGGYVVTGWMDTPITTSGIVDDQRRLKFAPDDWRMFNADRVLLIDRERRRKWQGGDRPARRDPFAWWQGERAEMHVLLSNGSDAIGPSQLEWSLSDTSGARVADGKVNVHGVNAGAVNEIAMLNIEMPRAAQPLELTLRIALGHVHNAWRLWAVPHSSRPLEPMPHVVAELDDDVLAHVRTGGFALLWQARPDARFTRSFPFWREAIHIFEPHPLWERVPHAGYADMRFFSVATDLAFDRAALQSLLDVELIPIWRRFDARQMVWAEYLAEARLGAGRLFISTLRFAGGLGHQPDTLDTNPWGSWMLDSLLETGMRD